MTGKRAYSKILLRPLSDFLTSCSSAFLLGLFFLAGCAAGNSEYDNLIARGDYSGAKQLIRGLLEEYSYRDYNVTMPARRAQLYYWLANAHAKLKEYDSLQLALSLCVSSDPGFDKAREQFLSEEAESEYNKAVVSYNARAYSEAITEWKTALDLITPIADRPFQAQIHRNLGFVQAATNDTARALHHFRLSADLGDSISQNLMLAYQRMGTPSPPTALLPLKDVSESNVDSPEPSPSDQKHQTQRGVYSISGSISLSSSSTDIQVASMKTSSFEFAPSFSLFIVDRVELTLAPSYSTTTSEYTFPYQPRSTSGSTGLGITLDARYYFPFETFAPFVGAGGGLSWSKFDNSDFNNSFSIPVKTYNFAAGVDYFLVRSLALEPQFQYRGSEREEASSSGIFVSIGVKYFIF